MSILSHSGRPIAQMSNWPHEDDKWKVGRSAMELARHWTGPDMVPLDVRQLLEAEFGSIHVLEGQPEKATSLPPLHSRGPRMHDLWLKGRLDEDRQVTICVEAKADESFGETVAEYQRAAVAALKKSPNSKMKARLGLLQTMIWGQSLPGVISSLRYQLLSALTGTAIQTLTDQSAMGILLIHVFDTSATTAANRHRNTVELATFLSTLTITPSQTTTRKGHVLGRVKVTVPADFSPGGTAETVEVHVAKLTTVI